jgi:hypothetical protein
LAGGAVSDGNLLFSGRFSSSSSKPTVEIIPPWAFWLLIVDGPNIPDIISYFPARF